jgi:NitT/TauT family transport system permease protein/taurine transport system permease protein
MALVNVLARLRPFALLAVLMLLWELFARYVLPLHEPEAAALILPPPSAGLVDAYRLLSQGVLEQHIFASARRVYVGFALAALIGIPLGVLMGMFATAYRQLTPIVGILRPIPPVAWIPITLLWFGVTDTQQYFIIFIGTIFPILLNTTSGVRSVDPVIVRAAMSLGAHSHEMFRVMLIAALPSIFLGVRIGLGLGWFIIVASEMVSASTGLGFLITEARTAMITERMYVGMFAIGIIGFLQDRLLATLERKLIPWK